MKVQRCEQHNIKLDSEFGKFIDDYCFKSKNLYNYGNYIVRQEFVETSKEKENGLRENANWIQYNQSFHILKQNMQQPYTYHHN